MKYWKHQFHFGYYDRPSVIVNTEAAYEEASVKYGRLISCSMAATMAGVSDQRIQRLVELGKFTKIVVFRLIQIPKTEFDGWKNSARISGRPRRRRNGCLPPTISESAKAYDDQQLFTEPPAQSKGC